MSDSILVEVCYGTVDKQKIVEVEVPGGTSVLDAARQSGLEKHFQGLEINEATALGIYGKRVPKPAQVVVKEGDRIEIYRPLIADPKEIRKKRAALGA
jgi:putative ubiquitin-RnfH superfamily antitoxin RatB of RatAB toxin-antitoxin module